jgi:hypothetical protein
MPREFWIALDNHQGLNTIELLDIGYHQAAIQNCLYVKIIDEKILDLVSNLSIAF